MERNPADLRNATVAIEDQRFYKHKGIDLTGLFRSAVKDLTSGQALQGGSTLEMQLVRNLYLGNDNRTVHQKIVEAKLAEEYAEHHSRKEILTNYLNSVPYGTLGGQTAIGVQAAARIFFDKPASQLNLAQSALLAGLPQAPSQYNPFLDSGAAKERRNEVLAKMAELRLHLLRAGLRRGGLVAAGATRRLLLAAPRELLLRICPPAADQPLRHSATVEQGGLNVYTTIDPRMQGLARKAIAEVLDEKADPAAAIVTRPAQRRRRGDGAVRELQPVAVQPRRRRPPPARLDVQGDRARRRARARHRPVRPPSTSRNDSPPAGCRATRTYTVNTFEGTSRPAQPRAGLVTSDNTVFAQLAADLGENTVTTMAYQLGVTTHLDSFPAEALGGLTYGVTPLEMAIVYVDARRRRLAQHADRDHQGRLPERPHRLQLGHSPASEGALERRHRGRGDRSSQQNVLGGTATHSAIDCPSAAKTGTTSKLVDAWLDGFTPNLTTVVWMGYPRRTSR